MMITASVLAVPENSQQPAAASTGSSRKPLPLSVVIPVHDEVANISPLVHETRRALRGVVDFEIIVVDDGSCDGTHKVLNELVTNIPELRIVSHAHRCGQSTAIWHGVYAAQGIAVATLDGDGQNNPADLPQMLQQWSKLHDSGLRALIAGFRQRRQDHWWRRVCSKVANRVRRFLLCDDTPDSGCGIKVFDACLFLELPYFDHMHRFLPALARRHGAEIISLPVDHRPRQRGHSHYGTWDRLRVGIVDLLGVMWLLRRSQLPVNVSYQGKTRCENGCESNLAINWTDRPVAVHRSVSRAVA